MIRIEGTEFFDTPQSLEEGIYVFQGLASPALQDHEHLVAAVDHVI